eukprot:6410608-Prymnesium_polylepis.1
MAPRLCSHCEAKGEGGHWLGTARQQSQTTLRDMRVTGGGHSRDVTTRAPEKKLAAVFHSKQLHARRSRVSSRLPSS